MEEAYQGTAAGAESGYQPTGGYQPQQSMQNAQSGQQSNPDWDFFNSNFKAMVPPQYQSMVSKYNTLTEFLDSHNGALGLIGKKFNEFAKNDFQTYANLVQEATGVPADPSGYQLERQEGSILTKEDETYCRNMAYNLGLNNNQANGLQKEVENLGLMIRDADYQQQMTVQKELEQRWGNNYAYKEHAVQNAFTSVIPQLLGEPTESFGDELRTEMAHSRVVSQIVALLGELAMSTPTGGYGNTTTPQGAAATIEQLRGDPDFMNKYINTSHPQHAQAKETMQKLLRLKNNEL